MGYYVQIGANWGTKNKTSGIFSVTRTESTQQERGQIERLLPVFGRQQEETRPCIQRRE